MQTIQELQEQLKAVNDAIYAIMVGICHYGRRPEL